MARWEETEAALVRIGGALKKPARITVIGSVLSMSMGQGGRETGDVDIWRQTSCFDPSDFRQACESAGVSFNPKGYVVPDSLYVQLVDPDIVHLGEFKDLTEVQRYGNLTVDRPPIENIIASKMVRGEGRDYDDSVFLMQRCRLDADRVRQAIESIDDFFSRESAMENFESMCGLLEFSSKRDQVRVAKNSMRH